MAWLTDIVRDIDEFGAVVRVSIVRADGSTPRETGAAMRVSARTVQGTIGGGALELTAIAHARALLARGSDTAAAWTRDVRELALGPSLGQCCGGHTRLLFEVLTMRERAHMAALARDCDADRALLLRPLAGGMPPCAATDRRAHRAEWPLAVTRTVRDMLSGARAREAVLARGGEGEPAWFIEPLARRQHALYVYGAGHVGRALVHVLRDLPFATTWVDTHAARFPDAFPRRHARRSQATRRPRRQVLPPMRCTSSSPTRMRSILPSATACCAAAISASSA
jgi:xanthine dehydrogenase accessory factor